MKNSEAIAAAQELIDGIRAALLALELEDDEGRICKLAVFLRRDASRLEALVRQMARKPATVCEVVACYEPRSVDVRTRGVGSKRVGLCAKHALTVGGKVEE